MEKHCYMARLGRCVYFNSLHLQGYDNKDSSLKAKATTKDSSLSLRTTKDQYSTQKTYIQKCPGALTILKYIKTKIKSICEECALEQKCLELFLEYISVTAVLQVLV